MTIVLRGGHLIDPAIGLDQVADLVIRDGRIIEIGLGNKGNRRGG